MCLSPKALDEVKGKFFQDFLDDIMTSQNATVLSECPVWARGNFLRVPLSTCCCQNASFALNLCNLSVLVSKFSFFFPFSSLRCAKMSVMYASFAHHSLSANCNTYCDFSAVRKVFHSYTCDKFYHRTATGLFVTGSGSKSCWSKYQHSCEPVASNIHMEWQHSCLCNIV